MKNNNLVLEFKNPINGIVQLILSNSLLGGNDAIEFQKDLSELISDEAVEVIVFDLANVEQINSSGLGMLVASNSNILRSKKKLILVNLSSKVQDLVKMTHLDKVLNISNNLESAL